MFDTNPVPLSGYWKNTGRVLSLVEYGEIKYTNNRKKRTMRTTSKKREGDKSVKEINEWQLNSNESVVM